MGFVRCNTINEIDVNDYNVTPGHAMDTAFASSFIDTRGRFRYVPNCSHGSTAPDIADMDDINPSDEIRCTCDMSTFFHQEYGCNCRASYVDFVDVLEGRGYIHLSIVTLSYGYELNLFTEKAPNQTQIGTLWDFYMATPEDGRDEVGHIIDRFLRQHGHDALCHPVFDDDM